MFKFRKPAVLTAQTDVQNTTDPPPLIQQPTNKGGGVGSLFSESSREEGGKSRSFENLTLDPHGKSGEYPRPQTTCDMRKRKERQESLSESSQEKKFTRSLSHEEGKGETSSPDFRRTQSTDDFQQSNPTSQKLLSKREDRKNELNRPSDKTTGEFIPSVKDSEEIVPPPKTHFGMVHTMPSSFEPEIQRQLERSAQWCNRKIRKTHRTRSYKPQLIEENKTIGIDEDVEEDFDIELNSPNGSSSSSTNGSLEDLDKKGVEDEEEFGQRNEPHEPISFRAVLHGPRTDDQVLLSPRNSLLIKAARDPNIPPSPPQTQAQMNPPLSRQVFHGGEGNPKMNALSRQVGNLKRFLKILEDEHEQLFGYRPSHADKLNHKEMRKCLLQLSKAKRELKQMREDPSGYESGNSSISQYPDGKRFEEKEGDDLQELHETVREIEAALSEKRRSHKRPEDLNEMSPNELADEKNAMQRQLLILERRHGRPKKREEKEIVRCLYERYRAVKKIGSRLLAAGSIKESLDLAPIFEHEALEIPETSEGNSRDIKGSPGRRRRQNQKLQFEMDETLSSVSEETLNSNRTNEGFHDMNVDELESRMRVVKDEKRRLRTVLRRFEADFECSAGRPPLKEEKYYTPEMEVVYQKYKRLRATLRLLDVLITKRRFPRMIVDLNTIED